MLEAENGRDAIEKAQQLRPDLIVLDMSMPVMNGLDAARALKRLMSWGTADYVQRFRSPMCGAASLPARNILCHFKV